MKKFNKIIFFIGPSSAGKDFFLNYSLNRYRVKPITLLTTRPMRPGEKEGREYYFIDQERMDLLEKRNMLIERRNYNTNYGIWSYATGVEEINLKDFNYLTLNTWEGDAKFLNIFSRGSLVPIYFQVDDGTRLERALKRERESMKPNYEEMCRRFLADAQDFSEDMLNTHKPFIVDNNGSQEETLEQIDDIFTRKLNILPK